MQSILNLYLSCLNVPHTRRGCRAVYESNPYKNTMYGLAEMLREYGIPAEAEKYDLKNPEIVRVPAPCVAIIDNKFAVIRSVAADTVTYQTDSKVREMTYGDFLKQWDGVALKGTPDAASREPDYLTNHSQELASRVKGLLFAVALVVLALAVGISNTYLMTWWGLAVLAVNIAGLYVGYLLVLKQLHIGNTMAERLCGLIKESRCDSPKLTEASHILGMVTLSEVGVGFFFVNTIILLFVTDLLPAMALLSAVGLLFSFWSIWYQKTKAKTWCTLCLIILSLMWAQVILLLIGGVYGMGNLWSMRLITTGAFYGAAIIAVSYIDSFARKLLDYRDAANAYAEMKAIPEVMHLMIRRQPEIDKDKDLQSSMVFGNAHSGKTNITVFANPYCIPCAEMHKHMALFLAAHPDASVRYTMTYFSDAKSVINRYFIAAYQTLGASRTWQLLTEWYAGGKLKNEEFFNGLNLNITADSVTAEFEKQQKWREETGLTATPVILINGHKLPAEYSVDDLEYLS